MGWPGSACKSPHPTLYVVAAAADDDDDGSGDDGDDGDDDDDDDADDDDDDDDPVELFQTRGKWWELIVTLVFFGQSFKLSIYWGKLCTLILY